MSVVFLLYSSALVSVGLALVSVGLALVSVWLTLASFASALVSIIQIYIFFDGNTAGLDIYCDSATVYC